MNNLSAKVKATNLANDYANKLFTQLHEALTPLVGKQVLKVTGQLLEKVKARLPNFPNTPELHVYRLSSELTWKRGSLAWVVKTCEFFPPYSCCYHETTVSIGKLWYSMSGGGGVLVSLANPPAFRINYMEEEILAKRETYKAAKKLADEALANLYPFGEYDR